MYKVVSVIYPQGVKVKTYEEALEETYKAMFLGDNHAGIININ